MEVSKTDEAILSRFHWLDRDAYIARRAQIAAHAAAHPGSETGWAPGPTTSADADFDRGGDPYRAPQFHPLADDGEDPDDPEKKKRAADAAAGIISVNGRVMVRFVR